MSRGKKRKLELEKETLTDSRIKTALDRGLEKRQQRLARQAPLDPRDYFPASYFCPITSSRDWNK